jgi:hypothetical protein
LLPALIFLNFFFGWIFLRPLYWLLSELILILLFVLNSYIIARKISPFSSGRDDAIDVKAEVIEEKKELR